MHQFACPNCGSRLRLKDKSFAGRTVHCPDCSQPVTIELASDGALTGVAASRAAADSSTLTQPATQTGHASAVGRLISPALAAWLIALAGFAALLVYVFRSSPEPQMVQTPDVGQPVDDFPPEQPPEPVPAADTPEARLVTIGRQIATYVGNHGVFPAAPSQPALASEQRLSWISTLIAAEAQAGARPDLDHAWNEPANDRFVRQRFEVFQNPNIDTLTGPAGHPVAHFAGIGGVGADAPGLPVTHPRAGIFGRQRTTGIDDVKDGLGATMLVAGVQERLDSWAANGPATVRPLTAEPYFNGPDGLGTGEQGGMTVLMADGSVRFLSPETDPRLMRRMAAMADGLPLDVAVPGEPGETFAEPLPVVVEPPPGLSPEGPDAEPIEVALAADEPVFDMDAALNQPIAEFNQSTPRPVREILKLIAEMAGVAVDGTQLDESAAGGLDEITTLALRDTTVRGVLDATVEAANLTYSLGNGVVVLIAGEADAVKKRPAETE